MSASFSFQLAEYAMHLRLSSIKTGIFLIPSSIKNNLIYLFITPS